MTDLARLTEGRVGAQFWSIYIPGEIKDSGFARVQLEQFDIARRMIARYPDRLMLALTADDIVKAKKQKKIASLLGMEGGHAIENSLGALRSYYDLGARYMTLTHNVTLDWADAALDSARHDGLDSLRRGSGPRDEPTRHAGGPVPRVTRRDERCAQRCGGAGDLLPLLLPCAGGLPSQRSRFDSREIAPERRSRDGHLRAWLRLKRCAGGETANGQAIDSLLKRRDGHHGTAADCAGIQRQSPGPHATLAQVADHIEHVRQVAGVDHVGIGSDFDGIDAGPDGLEDVSKFPALFAELIRRGWSDADLKKLAGENVLRVLRQAEAVAKKDQQEREPSTKTIEELDGGRGRVSEGLRGLRTVG